MRTELSIIIVNYNVRYFLEHCLHSVTRATDRISAEIIVVDNHSTDGSREYFHNRFPNVNFFWNDSNTGFARANNMGLKHASGKYILFLNPDTLLPEDCLEKCLAFIRTQNDHCALGVKMLDGSGKFLKESKRSFPHPHTSLFKLSGLARLFPRSGIFAKYYLGHLDEHTNHEVDVLAGAFMMMPAGILQKVKGFDEDFFMYGEDIDLSYRIQQAGFRNFYFAETSILHFKGESTKKGSLNYVKMFYRAMNIFVRKHYRTGSARLYNIFIHLAIGLRAMLSAGARFFKWIGLPFIDAGIILLSFYGVKFIWSTFIRPDVIYLPKLLLIPLFTILFLVTSWLTGLYDSHYKPSRLYKSTLLSTLVLLSFYALLPENERFSRGILLFGSFTAFGLMILSRKILLQCKVIEEFPTEKDQKEIVIIGTHKEFEEVLEIFKGSVTLNEVFGRISPGKEKDESILGNFSDVLNILKLHPVKQIIFCQGTLSFYDIISLLPKVSSQMRFRFYAAGISSIIGSDDSNVAGKYIVPEAHNFHLNDKVYRRGKRLLDLLISLIILLTFPLHLVLKKRPGQLIKNALNVFSGHKTWVSYGTSDSFLPPLKEGIITPAGFRENEHDLPRATVFATDQLYARHYTVLDDIRLLWRNYHYLS